MDQLKSELELNLGLKRQEQDDQKSAKVQLQILANNVMIDLAINSVLELRKDSLLDEVSVEKEVEVEEEQLVETEAEEQQDQQASQH